MQTVRRPPSGRWPPHPCRYRWPVLPDGAGGATVLDGAGGATVVSGPGLPDTADDPATDASAGAAAATTAAAASPIIVRILTRKMVLPGRRRRPLPTVAEALHRLTHRLPATGLHRLETSVAGYATSSRDVGHFTVDGRALVWREGTSGKGHVMNVIRVGTLSRDESAKLLHSLTPRDSCHDLGLPAIGGSSAAARRPEARLRPEAVRSPGRFRGARPGAPGCPGSGWLPGADRRTPRGRPAATPVTGFPC